MPAIAAIIARHLKEGAEVGLGLAEVLDQRDPVDRLLQPPQAKASVFGRTAAEARGKAVVSLGANLVVVHLGEQLDSLLHV